MSPPKRVILSARAASLSILLAQSGLAAPPELPPPGTNPKSAATEMPYNLPVDLSITIGGLALWTTLELLKPTLASPCRWCDRDAAGNNTLNAFDTAVRNALRSSDTRTADTWSTVFSFGLAPAAGVAIAAGIAKHDHRMDELPADLLVVAESAAIAVNVNEISKYAFARERPFVHFRTPEERAKNAGLDDNLSFFSGHATLAFALSTSAGTIASMRHYRLAPAMWITGMALATVGAYLRIAADRHYGTDVLTGMVVGAGVGFSVPYVAHRPTGLPVRVTPMAIRDGAGLALSGTW